MLNKDPFIISPATFQLIQELQSFAHLNGFFLVGGTSLALQIGHRNSIDIDLFTQKDFDADKIITLLAEKYSINEIFKRKNTLISLINNIKTDFIKHDYPIIAPIVTEEGIRMFGKEDIAAMKIHAIIQSGQRLKDFIDIYYLLHYFTLTQLLEFFEKKYTYSNRMIALKALTYFDDIDPSIDPPKMKNALPLDTIKKRIKKASLQPHILF